MKTIWKIAVAKDVERQWQRIIGTDEWLQTGELLNVGLSFADKTDQQTAYNLFLQLEQNTGYKVDDKFRTWQIVLANLIRYRRRPVGVSFNRNFWAKPENKIINYAIMDQLKDLHRHEFINLKDGYNFPETGDIEMAKIWPTEKLLKYFPKNPMVTYKPVELVELRELNSSKQIPYRDTQRSREVRKELQKANELYGKQNICLPGGHEIVVNLKAIFKKNFSLYGRIHTAGPEHIQGLWEEERQELMINGQPVIELDYSALHPHLLYASEGIQYVGDPYLAGGMHPLLRPVLKILLMAMLHSDTRDQAAKAVNGFLFENPGERSKLAEAGLLPGWKWNKTGPRSRWRRTRPLINQFAIPLMEQFIETHQPVAHHFFSGKTNGLRIMNKDARIALEVLRWFTKKEIPCIPIHDSFLVPACYEPQLREVMERMYKKITGGFRCPIKRAYDPLDPELLVAIGVGFHKKQLLSNLLEGNNLISNHIN